jgi:predicted DNA-binding transcriptional regulator YafY
MSDLRLSITEALKSAPEGLTTAELAEATGLSISQIYDPLAYLQKSGEVLSVRIEGTNGKRYRLCSGEPVPLAPKQSAQRAIPKLKDAALMSATSTEDDDQSGEQDESTGLASDDEEPVFDFALWRSGVLSVEVNGETVVLPAQAVPLLTAYLNRVLKEAS